MAVKINGSPCAVGAECGSGQCIDKVCCNTACDGLCQTCATATGACSPVASGDDVGSCTGTMTCSAGACLGKPGATCSGNAQCASGFCVDGVCCNSACNLACQACNVTPGTCTAAPRGAPVGVRAPLCGIGVCGGSCNGTSPACVFPATTTTCRTASCIGAVATNPTFCDGAGTCPAATTTPCTPYACGAIACKTTCASNSDCVSGDFCSSDGHCNLDATQVVVGDTHTCALLTDGTVRCWGNGSPTPAQITGFPTAVKQLTAGFGYTCALTTAGGVFCWGGNGFGTLGNGTADSPTTPLAVTGLGSGVASISAGDSHTCALLTGGTLRCWGRNQAGQLGNNSSTTAAVPTPVTVVSTTGTGSLTGVVAVALGNGHTCAIVAGGAVRCWGANNFGQLGIGTTDGGQTVPHPVPLPVAFTGAATIGAGSLHTCATPAGGQSTCWGTNSSGELGIGTISDVEASPISSSISISDVTEYAGGISYTCGLEGGGATGGIVWCWGTNSLGQVGNSQRINLPNPSPVTTLADLPIQVAAKSLHTCAVLVTGAVQCWGNNGFGQFSTATPDLSTDAITVTHW